MGYSNSISASGIPSAPVFYFISNSICLIAYTILSTWFTHLTWNKVTAHFAQLRGLLASWLATGLPVSVQLAKNKHISLTITRVLTSSLCSFLFYIRKPFSALLFNFLLVTLASSRRFPTSWSRSFYFSWWPWRTQLNCKQWESNKYLFEGREKRCNSLTSSLRTLILWLEDVQIKKPGYGFYKHYFHCSSLESGHLGMATCNSAIHVTGGFFEKYRRSAVPVTRLLRMTLRSRPSEPVASAEPDAHLHCWRGSAGRSEDVP